MSEYLILAVIAGFAVIYSLLASRLEKTPVNGALVYVVVGFLVGPSVFGIMDLDINAEGLKALAEITLAIVLFSDSANANLKVIRSDRQLPTRLLLLGLPMTIALGIGLGFILHGQLSWLEIALVATMLAPTDAALGKAVVTNPKVPDTVREGLNVESGLNDGICVPVLLIFLSMATDAAAGESLSQLIIKLPVMAIGVGALVGLICGLVGSFCVAKSSKKGWLAGSWMQIPTIGLALLAFGLAQYFGGSGFIAAFVGGMSFGAMTPKHKAELLEASEGAGDIMSMLTWLAFGMLIGVERLLAPGIMPLLYALLSLTVVRMLPVVLATWGQQEKLDTKLFIGWFGPRGLASIVFLVMVMGEDLPGGAVIESTVIWTIVLSVIAHGLSANPLAQRYGKRVSQRGGVT